MSIVEAAPRSTRPDGPWSDGRRERDLPDSRVSSGLSLPDGERVVGTPYVVVRAIGRGGMGEVYEVEHAALGRRSVLKVLRESHRGRLDLAGRMRDEARALGALRHPNLVDVFDLGITKDGRPYFAMELLRGSDLQKELARTGPLTPWRALDIAVEVLNGLSAVHAAGLVHRDVKLENLFLCDDGSAKLLDFGVAKIRSVDPPRSQRGVSIGTPRTMAPEQCAFGEVDARTDIYAVGLVLYELITGRGPFDELRGNAHALRFAHAGRVPPPPSKFARVPAAIEKAILRALAKSPDDRFPSASAMAEALRVLRGERRRKRGSAPLPTVTWSGAPDVAAAHPSAQLDALGCASTHAAPKEGAPQVLSESLALRGREVSFANPPNAPRPQAIGEGLPPRPLQPSATMASEGAPHRRGRAGRSLVAACVAISVVALALAGAALEIAASDMNGASVARAAPIAQGCAR